MGAAVSYYRIYALDGADHIRLAFDAECQDDKAALVYAATAYATEQAIEVWDGMRMVGKVAGSSASRHEVAD
jgi:hypothetical protein